MIATGFPPFLFSENICNGKLALACLEEGIDLKVISKEDQGPLYGSEWISTFLPLQNILNQIKYPTGNKLNRLIDVCYSGTIMNGYFIEGIRWARRAYYEALKLLKKEKFDAIITRSPNDISHLIGYKLKKKTGVKWIANWNDPADPIWPGVYKHQYADKIQNSKYKFTKKLLNFADVNTFPSDSLRQHFISNFPSLINSNTAVLPHIGLGIKNNNPQDLYIKGNKLLFLHSGNLSGERKIENLCFALNKIIEEGFSDFEFHIMGNLSEENKCIIDRYALDNYVKVLGSLPFGDSLNKMREYDVLVLVEAILENGIFFASKITDYIEANRPILAISPKKGFAKDFILESDGHYFVDNQDRNLIYEKIMNIITDWGNNNLNCKNGKLLDYISPSNVTKKLKDIISSAYVDKYN